MFRGCNVGLGAGSVAKAATPSILQKRRFAEKFHASKSTKLNLISAEAFSLSARNCNLITLMFEELCFMAKVLWESMCVRESARRVLWRKFIIFSMRNYFAPAIKSWNSFRREIKKLILNKT